MDAILCRPVTQGMLNRRFPKLGFHGAYDPHFIVRGKSGNQVSCTEDFFKEWCCAFLCFAKFCGNLGRQIPGKPMCRFADGAKQVVPLSLQNEFVLTRVTCRFLRNGANKFAVSLRERGRINECWICKLSSLGTSVLRCNERIKDCLINRMSSVQSSAYICFSRQWFKFFMLDGTLDFGQMNRCLLYWT